MRSWATRQVEVHGYWRAKQLIKRLASKAEERQNPAAWLVWVSEQQGYPWMGEGDWTPFETPSLGCAESLVSSLAASMSC